MYQDMKQWFWENGRSSDGFMELAETIQARWTRQAEANSDELVQLRQMRPEDHPDEAGIARLESYQTALENAKMYHRRNVAMGYIDK
jgi:hypothetical protein